MMTAKKKILSVLLKAAGIALALLILVLIAASVYIQKNKDSIIKKITADLNEKLNGELTISSTDISIWSTFPTAGADFFSVQLKDSLYKIPLLSVSKLQCRISLFSLFSSNKTLSSLIIEGGELHLFTDTNGYTNKYLLKGNNRQKNESAGSSLMNIHKLQLKNCSVLIEDSKTERKFQFSFSELQTPVENNDSAIALKLSGELGDESTSLIDSTVAICCPVDLEESIHLLAKPANKLYHRFYLDQMVQQTQRWTKPSSMKRADCSTAHCLSGPASSAARPSRRAATAAITTPTASACGWPAAA